MGAVLTPLAATRQTAMPLGSTSAAAAFDPSSIAGLAVWLKADAITGLTDGQSLTTWNDSSGNGVNPTEATNKPAYKTAIQNGLPIVRFTRASSQKLQVAYTGLNGLSGRSVFIVFKQAATGVNQTLLAVDSASNVIGVELQPWHDGNLYDSVGTTAAFCDFPFSSTSFVLAESVFDGTLTGNTNRLKMWLNGAAQTEASGGTIVATTGTNTKLTIGTCQLDPNFFGGDVAEILIYNSALSSTDRGNIESYLNSKWSLF